MSKNFSLRSLDEALGEFRPAHVTAVRRMPLATVAGLVAAAAVPSPTDLPGFRRSAVDGYAVRAQDTGGATPAGLAIVGSVRIGSMPATVVGTGQAVEIPTGGALPDGADAVVMVERTAVREPGRVELSGTVRAGDNVVQPDDDVARGTPLVAPGRPIRPHDIGLLAAAGLLELDVHRRPVVGVLATGDEVVGAGGIPGAAQVRDANSPALAALIEELGGRPLPLGIVSDDPGHLERAFRDGLARCDLLVVSAGSSIGARDATAEVVARLGPPGIWCHGLAVRPGRPTLLAEVLGRPLIGLPGNPVSALVVMRLIGAAVIARLAGRAGLPPAATVTGTLDSEIASRVGRTDVVQVVLRGDRVVPLFGKVSQLSLLGRADGYLVVPAADEGLTAGSPVAVTPYR